MAPKHTWATQYQRAPGVNVEQTSTPGAGPTSPLVIISGQAKQEGT